VISPWEAKYYQPFHMNQHRSSPKKFPEDPEDYWLILNGLPHLGPVTLRRLMDAFEEDIERIFSSGTGDLKKVEGVGDQIATTILNWQDHFDLEREKRNIRTHGANIITWKTPHYPKPLREIYDPPIALYQLGDWHYCDPAVAIIGSRRTSLYGLRTAREFGAALARRGICVISGLARGIDAAAHEGALSVNGPTVAVLGNGCDIIYPPENVDLFRKLREKGTILSEFPFGYRASRQSFPMRNRVVSGLCRAVLVVETDESGGSMITARFAGEQGRQVMAIPGRIDQATSAGCHQLIRDGATLVTCVEHILEELRLEELPLMNFQEQDNGRTSSTGQGLAGISPEEEKIIAQIKDGSILHMDQIAAATQLPSHTVASTLLLLELKKMVRKKADGRFEYAL